MKTINLPIRIMFRDDSKTNLKIMYPTVLTVSRLLLQLLINCNGLALLKKECLSKYCTIVILPSAEYSIHITIIIIYLVSKVKPYKLQKQELSRCSRMKLIHL